MKKLQSKRITKRLNKLRLNIGNLESETWMENSNKKDNDFFYSVSFSLERRFFNSRNIPMIEVGSFVKISDLKIGKILKKYAQDEEYLKITTVDVYKFAGMGHIFRINLADLDYIDEFFLGLELGTLEEEEALKIASETDIISTEYLDAWLDDENWEEGKSPLHEKYRDKLYTALKVIVNLN